MSGTAPPGGNTQGFPNNVIAFTHPTNGQLTPAAYRFLLSIWQRTGGGTGGGGGTTVITGFSLMEDAADAASLSPSALLLTDTVEQTPAPQDGLALMLDTTVCDAPAPNAVMAAEMAAAQDAPKTYPGLWAMIITDEGP